MNFVAIDFETANSDISSVCQVGIVVIENGRLAQKLSWLVHPPQLLFNRFNTYVHGICAQDVEDQPQFDVLWPEIKGYLEKRVVIAHNASFDIHVLRSILDVYKLDYPTCDYCCSVKIAKKVWSDLQKHGLKSLSKHLAIEFNHHDACEDAYASARIVIEAAKKVNVNSFQQMLDKLEIRTGRLYPGGFVPIHQLNQFNLKKADPAKLDPGHPFYGQTLVFSGALECMQRKDAMQKIADVGGICAASVNEHTDFLIVGSKTNSRFKEGYKSKKIIRAEELVGKGFSVEMISEEDFIRLLQKRGAVELPLTDAMS